MLKMRTRKLIGAIVLLTLVIVWALVAMAVAPSALQAGGIAQAVYYVLAGLGWILPAMPLISWMSRPDPGA